MITAIRGFLVKNVIGFGLVGRDELSFKYFELELTLEHLGIDTHFPLKIMEVELKRKIKLESSQELCHVDYFIPSSKKILAQSRYLTNIC